MNVKISFLYIETFQMSPILVEAMEERMLKMLISFPQRKEIDEFSCFLLGNLHHH